MKVLILGGSGMLGHKLWQVFAARFDTVVTFRQSPDAYAWTGLFDPARAIGGVSVENFDGIVRAVAATRPDAVVNCIGIVKQAAAARDPVPSLSVNALYPHRLADVCRAARARLVHISTDCVFSGRKGNYTEQDVADAEDLYGRSKLLGEVTGPGCFTLRTSIIGRELEGSHGLVEWFLGQTGKTVRGFKRAIFSGFTTNALAEIIADVLTTHPTLEGLWQVAAEPIDKFSLLSLVNRIYHGGVTIEPDEGFVCDRSLDGSRFRQATGLVPPTWPAMIEAMRQDPTPYDALRSQPSQISHPRRTRAH